MWPCQKGGEGGREPDSRIAAAQAGSVCARRGGYCQAAAEGGEPVSCRARREASSLSCWQRMLPASEGAFSVSERAKQLAGPCGQVAALCAQQQGESHRLGETQCSRLEVDSAERR